MKRLITTFIVAAAVAFGCSPASMAATPADQEAAIIKAVAALRGDAEANAAKLATATARIAELERQLAAVTPKSYAVQPGGSIQAALDKAKAGDVVAVAPATYAKQTFKVGKGVTLDLAGVTLDGGGLPLAGTIGEGATLRGAKLITNYKGGYERKQAVVQIVGDDAKLLDNTFRGIGGTAVSWNEVDRPTIAGNTFSEIGGSPILGGGGNKESLRPVVARNTIERYNLDRIVIPSGPGVMKFTRTVEGQWLDNVIRDGHGPGIWLDIGNRRAYIAGNVISGLLVSREKWDAIAIYLELTIGEGTVVERNRITGKLRTQGGYAAAVCIAETFGTTVRNNDIDGGDIELRQQLNWETGRPRSFGANYDGKGVKQIEVPLRDILIVDNTVANGIPNRLSTAGKWPGVPKDAKIPTPEPAELVAALKAANIVRQGK